jgi:MerR family transcriptional regulator, copper efflux regulator
MDKGMKIGELAHAVGVNIQTLRYYERLNLLQPSMRKPSGYRLYDGEALKRLRFIKNAQSLGFTLHEVTELLNLRVSSIARCGDVQRKAQTKLQHVEDKIRALQALARPLRVLIQHCRAGQPTEKCPILKSFEQERRRSHGHRQATC